MLNSCEVLEVQTLINIDPFLNQPIIVLTSLGPCKGILISCDKSGHSGLGRLLLRNKDGYIIIGQWVVIKK